MFDYLGLSTFLHQTDILFHEVTFECLCSCKFISREMGSSLAYLQPTINWVKSNRDSELGNYSRAPRLRTFEKIGQSFSFIVLWSIKSIITDFRAPTKKHRALFLYAHALENSNLSVRSLKSVSIRILMTNLQNILALTYACSRLLS